MAIFARVRRHLARHGEWWWAPVFYALVVAWIYRGLWHQHGGATGLGWDTIDTHGPDLDFFANDLAHGRFSLWNPYDKGGYPVFCDPVFDRYYPFNWPFATLGALFGTSWWLVQIKVLAHHVVAGACMHLFLRTRGISVRGAMIGGVGLAASAPLLVHKASNILWPIVWVPLVWVAIDAALAKPSWRRGVGVAAALVPVITAGSPPGMFYAALLIAPYGVWRLVPVIRERRAEWRRLAACLGVAIGVSALVLAVTVLPTRQLVELGSRDRLGTGPEFALASSLPLPAAVRGLFARGAGLFEMYVGASVALLAVCAVVVRPRFDRGAAIAMIAYATLGVVLAGGVTTPLLPWLVAHVPGFGLLRVPGRYKLLCAWSLAAGAGYGAATLEAAWGDRKLRVRVLACAAAALGIVIVAIANSGQPAGPKDRAAIWSIVAMAIAGGLACAAVMVPKRWLGVVLGGFAIVALIDAPLFTFVEPGAPTAAEPRQTHAHDDEIVARLDGVRDRWRVYDEFVLGERAGARLQIRDFRGYPAIDPISLHRYVDVLDFAKHDAAIITDYNVRWVLARPHFRYGNTTAFVAMPNASFEPRGGNLWEASHPAPLVEWVGAVEVVTDPHRVLAAVRAIEEPDGARRRAVIEDPALVPDTTGAPDSREGTLDSYEPDAIRFSIDAPRAGLVVLDEIMFPGWEVEIDGAAATPVRANYLLRGVWVGAGHHAIAWRFSPAHWKLLVGGYVLALAIMLGACVTAAWVLVPLFLPHLSCERLRKNKGSAIRRSRDVPRLSRRPLYSSATFMRTVAEE